LGVELSEVAIATARAKGRQVVRPGELDSAGQYDVVSLFETLEHITDPDPVLADVARVLAPAGVIMITVPNRASFEISILRHRCFHVFGGSENVGHINLFDARGVGALLERHGLSLIFTDGQFSSDLPQVFSYLASSGPSALDAVGKDRMDLALPEPAYTVLNNLGPAFSCLERVLKRSPMLIAIACRTADCARLAEACAVLEQNWRDEMLGLIADQARSRLEHETEFRSLIAALEREIARRDDLLAETAAQLQQQVTTGAGLQQEINRRDDLLQTTQQIANDLQRQLAEAQLQINLRDDLLIAAQKKLDETIDARLLKALRVVRKAVKS